MLFVYVLRYVCFTIKFLLYHNMINYVIMALIELFLFYRMTIINFHIYFSRLSLSLSICDAFTHLYYYYIINILQYYINKICSYNYINSLLKD